MGSFTVSVRGVSLDSCIEARAVPVRSCGVDEVWGEALFFSLTRIKLCRVFSRVFFAVSSPGVYSVARSGLRTLPDGEFDWGGTSVKR